MNEVQLKIFNIFCEVKEICERHNIPYYAIGGTCIGAVRHHGFIPWDDDLDIAIPVDDYERFLEAARTELPDGLKLYSDSEIRHYRYIFSKVIDTSTTFIEDRDKPYKDAYKGIFIDIMPISGVPESNVARKLFITKILIYTILDSKLRFPVREFETVPAKLLCILMKPWALFLHYDFFSKKYINLLKKNSFYRSKFTGYVWSLWISRLIFPTEWFAERIEVPFETTTITCPAKSDLYLKKQFGDYMKLPPENERNSHHNGIVFPDRAYINYL